MAGGLVDRRVGDRWSDEGTEPSNCSDSSLGCIWHQHLKFMLLTWIVVPDILLLQSGVEDCPLGGWQTLSRVRTRPLCSTPSLEKKYSPSEFIKISVEWKQRHYVSPKPTNLRKVL